MGGIFLRQNIKETQCAAYWSWVKICQAEKTIEIQLVRPTEVCGKVWSETNG